MKQSIFSLLMVGAILLNSCTQTEQQKKEINLDSVIEKTDMQAKEQTKENREQANDSQNNPVRECYEFIMKRDTFQISWVQKGDKLSGHAIFDNYQKDSSSGEVVGEYNAEKDIYVFWYNFQSEGMNSVSKLVFKKKDDLLVPGHGEIKMSGDTSDLANVDRLEYDKRFAYTKVDCGKMR